LARWERVLTRRAGPEAMVVFPACPASVVMQESAALEV
jgi:hypothetical protein